MENVCELVKSAVLLQDKYFSVFTCLHRYQGPEDKRTSSKWNTAVIWFRRMLCWLGLYTCVFLCLYENCTVLHELTLLGDGPAETEVLTCIRLSESKIAIKSGYGKYLSVDSKGRVVGRSDAIATREQWEPVFQDVSISLYTTCDMLYPCGAAFIEFHGRIDFSSTKTITFYIHNFARSSVNCM